jgi:cytochrome c-type biogenesis protein
MTNDFSVGVSFLAGLVSFLSPCVLPIVPGFLAYLAGSSLAESEGDKRRAVFVNTVFFVLGFSIVFAVLGVLLNTVLSTVAYGAQEWASRVGGVIIILFGLYLTKLIKIPFLEREYKFSMRLKLRSRYITSLLFGAAFAAGWTPCVGAVLGGILGLAAAQPGSAFYLLFAYAIGLGIPFLIVGFFAAHASRVINRYASVLNYVSIGFGVLLILLGVLIFTQQLNLIANFGFLNKLLLSN